ncbi:MAG: DEAD/DEAH box helicase family protein, partial [Myxococcota bacterium]
MLTLSFDAGTLLLESDTPDALDDLLDLPHVKYDERVRALRAPAIAYHGLFAELYRRQKRGVLTFSDEARAYNTLDLQLSQYREPYPHQREALDAWLGAGRRGLVVLPTGAGKSYIAELALWKANRSALIVAPTLDLMNQWYDILTTSFQCPVGIVGGGYHDVEDLTVTTYDSSYIHMERLGNRFGLIIFDEAHHLPGPTYAQAAEMSLAPWRLGLTATPERPDGQHNLLDLLIGPCVYRKRIKELAGQYLAEYTTVPVHVPLSEADAEAYHRARQIYRDFTSSQGIRMGSRHGW